MSSESKFDSSSGGSFTSEIDIEDESFEENEVHESKEKSSSHSLFSIKDHQFRILSIFTISIIFFITILCLIMVFVFIQRQKKTSSQQQKKLLELLDHMNIFEVKDKMGSKSGILLTFDDIKKENTILSELNYDGGKNREKITSLMKKDTEDDFVIFEKKDVSLIEYGEELIVENCEEETCKCSAYCTVYEQEEEMETTTSTTTNENERRKILTILGHRIRQREILLFTVAAIGAKTITEKIRNRNSNSVQEKAKDQLLELCESDELRDITCHCNVNYCDEGHENRKWVCQAICFEGSGVTAEYASSLDLEAATEAATKEILKYCKKKDQKEKRFSYEIYESYIKDKYIHCVK